MLPSSENLETIQVYEDHAQTFISKTSQETSGVPKEWIDESLQLCPTGTPILEIGSGGGRDASYISALGYDIICSDATDSFLNVLAAKGFQPRKINVLSDELGGPYGMVLANCVLLHLTRHEIGHALQKIHASLCEKGVFACSFRVGDKSFWDPHKVAVPRYFQLWQPEEMILLLRIAGFDTKWMRFGNSSNTLDKFYIVAVKV